MVLSDLQAANTSMSLAYRNQHVDFLGRAGNDLEKLIQMHLNGGSQQQQTAQSGF